MSDERTNDQTKPSTESSTVSSTEPSTESSANTGIGRRGFLEALVSLPVVGVFFLSFLQKRAVDETRNYCSS